MVEKIIIFCDGQREDRHICEFLFIYLFYLQRVCKLVTNHRNMVAWSAVQESSTSTGKQLHSHLILYNL